MVELIERFLIAMTDAQFDRVLIMVSDCLVGIKDAIITVWGVVSPLVSAYIAFLLIRMRQSSIAARKNITEKINEEAADAKADRKKIIADLSENSRMTREISRNQSTIDALKDARMTNSGKEIHTVVQLPGFIYEKFDLANGEEALWRQEKCEKGKRVRYYVTGPTAMAYHSHDVLETITVTHGVLMVESVNGIEVLHPGQPLNLDPGVAHSVKFRDVGEALVDWPDQQTDELKIIIYQK